MAQLQQELQQLAARQQQQLQQQQQQQQQALAQSSVASPPRNVVHAHSPASSDEQQGTSVSSTSEQVCVMRCDVVCVCVCVCVRLTRCAGPAKQFALSDDEDGDAAVPLSLRRSTEGSAQRLLRLEDELRREQAYRLALERQLSTIEMRRSAEQSAERVRARLSLCLSLSLCVCLCVSLSLSLSLSFRYHHSHSPAPHRAAWRRCWKSAR